MFSTGARHLPVVDEGDLAGFVSMRDLAGRWVNRTASLPR